MFTAGIVGAVAKCTTRIDVVVAVPAIRCFLDIACLLIVGILNLPRGCVASAPGLASRLRSTQDARSEMGERR
jgi:hypothetical protein